MLESTGLVTPFGREFVFDGSDAAEKASMGGAPERSGTVEQRAQRFLNDYFEGKSSPVLNPATGLNYGKELVAHDAFHEFANVGNTLRGEELVTVGESAANSPLRDFDLGGLTQQKFLSRGSRTGEIEPSSESEDMAKRSARTQGRVLSQQRGAARGSSLFRDKNSVGSFMSPPIQEWEMREMVNRGREYYDQIHSTWKNFVNSEEKTMPFYSGPKERADLSKYFIHGAFPGGKDDTSPLTKTQIRGGYGGGNQLPFGDIRQFMNTPLAPEVDYREWMGSMDRQLGERAKKIEFAVEKELAANTQQRAELDDWLKRKVEILEARASNGSPTSSTVSPEDLRRLNHHLDLGSSMDQAAEAVIGPRPPKPKDLGYLAENMSRYPRDNWGSEIKQELRTQIDLGYRNIMNGGPSAGLHHRPRMRQNFGEKGGNTLYLNPPNLGSNSNSPNFVLVDRELLSDADAEDILLTAARDAKDAPLVKRAIRAGTSVAADITGSLPLFDPEFRKAVDQGRAGDAAVRAGTEYAVGAVTAPVVGMAAGTLQRAAPRAAARVLPAVTGATRVGNPVAVASQLGGDSRRTPAQRVADSQAAARQRNAAIQARQRGPKWQIPTPWGPVKIPELGISESGGLFSGGNNSGRRIGTRAVLNGKPVVWAGDSYGWQSPDSAAKVGVR